ncbi:hypothetical protein B0O99DRAFT_630017 [Bisporella sp. PMI_857]|nr:hypothetical protein B0O99DRAFT_630017 [Bisporella sp. PMI_857]
MSSASENVNAKKHVRVNSGRARVVRRSTQGPLDPDEAPLINDPLSPGTSAFHSPEQATSSRLLSPTALSASQSQFPIREGNNSPRPQMAPRLQSPQPSNLSSNLSSNPSFKTAHSTLSNRGSITSPAKDFGYLLRPEIYHPLTLLDVPPPFRVLSAQPDPSTLLNILISSGHFRSAAIKAGQILTSSSPPISASDHEQIFALFYTRLSCLTLCNQTALASQEVKALEDLNSSYYRDPETLTHLVPWELRVLAVRLQGMGFNDARRGVMGYYDLAREARLILTTLKKPLSHPTTSPSTETHSIASEIELWETRLHDLGIRVGSALIEMEDLEGATRHLKSLKPAPSQSKELEFQKALLWLYLGDVESAHRCIASTADTGSSDKVILALSHIADNDPESSVSVWESLISESTSAAETAMYRQNLAVCHLYLGKLSSAREALEELVNIGNSFHALTFNLSTIYELCTERSRSLKIGLAERVAEMSDSMKEGAEVGWEKVNGDFKL